MQNDAAIKLLDNQPIDQIDSMPIQQNQQEQHFELSQIKVKIPLI